MQSKGNQGIDYVMVKDDIKNSPIVEMDRPVDKTAIMTEVENQHHHHSKPKAEVKLQKA